METNKDFDKDAVIKGRWTDRQKEIITSLMSEVNSVLKQRFPSYAESIELGYHLPENKIGAKFTAVLRLELEKYLGELQSFHLLEKLKDHPDATEELLKVLFNNHAVMLYEQVIHRTLSKSLQYLVKRATDEKVDQPGDWIDKGIRIIPTSDLPADVVLMNTDTFEKLKKGGANESN